MNTDVYPILDGFWRRFRDKMEPESSVIMNTFKILLTINLSLFEKPVDGEQRKQEDGR